VVDQVDQRSPGRWVDIALATGSQAWRGDGWKAAAQLTLQRLKLLNKPAFLTQPSCICNNNHPPPSSAQRSWRGRANMSLAQAWSTAPAPPSDERPPSPGIRPSSACSRGRGRTRFVGGFARLVVAGVKQVREHQVEDLRGTLGHLPLQRLLGRLPWSAGDWVVMLSCKTCAAQRVPSHCRRQPPALTSAKRLPAGARKLLLLDDAVQGAVN
jgi:hypothetical protein